MDFFRFDLVAPCGHADMSSKRDRNAKSTDRFVRVANASESDRVDGEARPGQRQLFGKYVVAHIGTVSLQLEEARVKAVQEREHSVLVLVISALAKIFVLMTKCKHRLTRRS